MRWHTAAAAPCPPRPLPQHDVPGWQAGLNSGPRRRAEGEPFMSPSPRNVRLRVVQTRAGAGHRQRLGHTRHSLPACSHPAPGACLLTPSTLCLLAFAQHLVPAWSHAARCALSACRHVCLPAC
eukprot:358619-Chlamydomonas_euryale.AAC.19